MSLYLISDTHFDHANIIKYCNRPFERASEMDEHIIRNWNERVQFGDTVLHGGDIAMARSEVAIEYAERVNGQLVHLDGNHDDIDQSQAPFPTLKSYYFTYTYGETEYEFYYTHWPPTEHSDRDDEREPPKHSQPPEWFDGWFLHGHVHNNDLKNFPFINPDEKFVNLSAELLNYTPIEIEELIQLIEHNNRYETIDDVDEL